MRTLQCFLPPKIENIVVSALKSCIEKRLKKIFIFWEKNYKEKKKLILCKFLVRTLQYFQKKIAYENMKKLHSKVAHNRPKLFFAVPAWLPKPAQNYFFIS